MTTDSEAKWLVEFCTCGFGGGDVEIEYGTRDEVLRGIESMDEYTDSTVIRIVSPSGVVSEKQHLGVDPEVPEK